jgi:hypothetical protein
VLDNANSPQGIPTKINLLMLKLLLINTSEIMMKPKRMLVSDLKMTTVMATIAIKLFQFLESHFERAVRTKMSANVLGNGLEE